MTIYEFCKKQNRGLLPREVNAAFPERTAKQIGDVLADLVSRGKMKKILIPSARRRYRYVPIEKVYKTRTKSQQSEVKVEVLPLVRLP